MSEKKNKRLLSTQKYIDGDKVIAYIKEHDICQVEITDKIGVSHGYIKQVAKRGYTNIGMWKLACEGMGVPEDYFDIKEPKPEKDAEPKAKDECLVDLADIQLSLNKLEELMKEQIDLLRENNRLLRGRLEKAERTNPAIGNTNSGPAHSFMINGVKGL